MITSHQTSFANLGLLMAATVPRGPQPVIEYSELRPKPDLKQRRVLLGQYYNYSPCTPAERKVKRREKKLERQRRKRGRR